MRGKTRGSRCGPKMPLGGKDRAQSLVEKRRCSGGKNVSAERIGKLVKRRRIGQEAKAWREFMKVVILDECLIA